MKRAAHACRIVVSLMLGSVLMCAVAGAQSSQEHDRELAKLKSRIAKIQKNIQRDVAKRDATLAKLGEIEALIQTLGKNIAALKIERQSSETHLAALREREREREAALFAAKAGLAEEVRTAFVNGRQEQLKLLLNQRDPAQLGRMSVYYQYFSRQRAAQIREVIARLVALRETTVQVALQTDRLKELQSQRERERAALESARAERKALVAQIGARLDASGSEVTTLEKEQARLEKLIAQLQLLLAEYPVNARDAFPKLKGTLAWPLTGRLLADFGQPRAGRSIKWNGVLVAANRGAPVRAIARGRVAYADWLPGLGLLTVLEHSDGHISLYGHNETLTRQAGEWVQAGDVLATVGDSGGQSRPALYFEIRRGKTPLNPHRWFKGSVSSR